MTTIVTHFSKIWKDQAGNIKTEFSSSIYNGKYGLETLQDCLQQGYRVLSVTQTSSKYITKTVYVLEN